MKWKKIVSISVLSGIIAVIVGTFALPTQYSGEEVFYTQREYSKFKQELVDSNAKYETDNIFVLSSEPPIIVRFEDVIVADDYPFSYGGKDSVILRATALGIIIMGLVFFLLVSRWFLSEKRTE